MFSLGAPYHPARYIAANCGTNARVQGEFLPPHDKLVEQPTLWIDYSAKHQRWTIFVLIDLLI